MARGILFFLLHLLLDAAIVRAEDTSVIRQPVPATVSVPGDLQRHIDSMLERSATFRAQCRRIADARSLRVIRVDPALVERSYRARTSFARTNADGIVARMSISLRPNPVEWIAREFEHVLEQLDGLSLPAWPTATMGCGYRTTGRSRRDARFIWGARSLPKYRARGASGRTIRSPSLL